MGKYCYIILSLLFFINLSIASPSTTIKMTEFEGMDEISIKINRMQGPFYFVDAPLISILEFLEKLLDKPIIYSSTLPQTAKFSFKSEKKIPHDDAIKIFRSMIMLNGIALIPVDGDKYYKAVPSAGVSTQVPEFLVGRASNLTPSQDFYTKFFELKYIQIADIESKLKSSLSQNNVGMFETFPKSNSFWVTDTLLNIQRIEAILDKLDTPTNETFFIQITNSSASDIKDKISALKLDEFANATISSDARTNKLIVVASKPIYEKVKQIVTELDIQSDAILKSEVVYVKHGEAAKIVEVLNKIVSGQKQSKSNKNARDLPPEKTLAQKPTSTDKKESDILQISEGTKNLSDEKNSNFGIEFSDYVQIVSEERSNAIVLYGTSNDLKQIKSIINLLDIVLTQVKIDVLITEVILSNDQVSGLSSFGLSYNASDIDGFSGSTQTYNLTNSSTPAFSISASETSFSFLLGVARQNQNVKVLSAPTIVTTHNKEAEVNISQSLPIITSSMSDITSITTTRSSVSYKDIGIRLLVTPLVGANGSIQLKIDQSVDSISGYTTIDNNQQPIISKRKATSFISAKNNEVITLAGLQQIDTTKLDGGVWFLSDIPLLGELFKPSKNEYTRRELIIFIRPTVIESTPTNSIIKGKEIFQSPSKDEIETFFKDGKFYKNGELEENAKEFEENRPHNRVKNAILAPLSSSEKK